MSTRAWQRHDCGWSEGWRRFSPPFASQHPVMCNRGVAAWSHMIPDDPCISMYVKLHHDSAWFIRSSLFEPIVHLQFHLIQFAAPEAVGKFISTNQIKRSFGIFVVNMGKPRNIKALTPHFRNDLSTHLWTSALDVRMTNYTLCHWPSNFWCSHLFSTGLPLQSVPWNDSKLLSWLDLMIFPRRSRNAIPLTPPTNHPFPEMFQLWGWVAMWSRQLWFVSALGCTEFFVAKKLYRLAV